MDWAERVLIALIALMAFACLVLVWYIHRGPCPSGEHPGAASWAPEVKQVVKNDRKYREILMVPTKGCVP